MFQAAKENHNYEFKFVETHYGRSITTIAGVCDNEATSQYWMIYNLPFCPDVHNPPGNGYLSPVGVDKIEVHDGYHYLFWYRTVNVDEHQ
ncbi:CLUMA_CG010290, isoform A [Clunio marinus]|uniref:CLUMA_CG010290, isoform A n=1 Tax=Clunio marinus TaxID=568069 RepID=A0A1J1I8H5_9DIPT|nr:CLUMA_CG010290, isoform A [Clunio marinus]